MATSYYFRICFPTTVDIQYSVLAAGIQRSRQSCTLQSVPPDIPGPHMAPCAVTMMLLPTPPGRTFHPRDYSETAGLYLPSPSPCSSSPRPSCCYYSSQDSVFNNKKEERKRRRGAGEGGGREGKNNRYHFLSSYYALDSLLKTVVKAWHSLVKSGSSDYCPHLPAKEGGLSGPICWRSCSW